MIYRFPLLEEDEIMLKILKTRFKQGCRTMLFPKAPAPALPSNAIAGVLLSRGKAAV